MDSKMLRILSELIDHCTSGQGLKDSLDESRKPAMAPIIEEDETLDEELPSEIEENPLKITSKKPGAEPLAPELGSADTEPTDEELEELMLKLKG